MRSKLNLPHPVKMFLAVGKREEGRGKREEGREE
jgi:hypothetical protein